VVEKYGDIRDEAFFETLFKDEPQLCGQTCAWLATGQGKELRGLYLGEFGELEDVCELTSGQIADRMWKGCLVWEEKRC
jgi:hypothetical protein